MVWISYSTPYDWPLVSGWLRTRLIAGVETFDDDEYRRDGVRVRHDASREALQIRGGNGSAARVRRLFDLDADPRAIRAVLAKDKLLAPMLRRRPGVRVPGAWDPFELALRAIVGQQVSVAAGRTILGRIAAAHGFAPARLAEVTIEGMPRRRAETIRLLARAVASGDLALERRATLDESIAMLTALPGIGPWTAHYIAMRALGEADAFPAGDLILRRHAGNLTERELLRRADAWRPFRAYGAMLLWTTPS
jgi:AraC family transcriptional regulator of adaptative response / DNA-3-methyladenine glycosylase II